MGVTHALVSAKADGADASLVRPSNWNADHAWSGAIDASAATSFAIGSNPPGSGALRIGGSLLIAFGNGAGGTMNALAQNGTALRVGGVDGAFQTIQFGAAAVDVATMGAYYLSIGSTPATTGVIRIPNNQAIFARGGGAYDTELARVTVLDTIQIGGAGGLTAYSGGWVSIGTTPATAGVIRIPNSVGIYARNAANSANASLMVLDGGNSLVIGDANAAGNIYIYDRITAAANKLLKTLTADATGHMPASQVYWASA